MGPRVAYAHGAARLQSPKLRLKQKKTGQTGFDPQTPEAAASQTKETPDMMAIDNEERELARKRLEALPDDDRKVLEAFVNSSSQRDAARNSAFLNLRIENNCGGSFTSFR